MLPILTCTLVDLATLPPDRSVIARALVKRAGANPVELRLDLADGGRVPVAVLGALPVADRELAQRGGRVRVIGTSSAMRSALRLANIDGLIGGAEEHTSLPSDVPCMLGFGDGSIEVCVSGQTLQSTRLASPASLGWIQAISATSVLVDLGELPVVNSVLVAWLLQLGQYARPASMEVSNVNRQVAIQFNQLRLHHLLTMREAK